MRYRLTYDASSSGDGSHIVVWEKTLEELLRPNGEDCLLVYMLKETEERGGPIKLERIVEGDFPDYFEEITPEVVAAAETEGGVQFLDIKGKIPREHYALLGIVDGVGDIVRREVIQVSEMPRVLRERMKEERSKGRNGLSLWYCTADGKLEEVG